MSTFIGSRGDAVTIVSQPGGNRADGIGSRVALLESDGDALVMAVHRFAARIAALEEAMKTLLAERRDGEV